MATTPTTRGVRLGSAERPGNGEARDKCLYALGAKTEVTLTAGGVDVSGGDSHVYCFGVVDAKSVGRYMFTAQSAGLGAVEYLIAEVREESAGVFKVDLVTDLDNSPAAGLSTNIAAAVRIMDTDTPVFTTTNGDSDVAITVTTAVTGAQLVTLQGSGATLTGATPALNTLCIVETRSTTAEKWTITRLS